MTDLTGLADETLCRAYEDIRMHVSADARSGRYRFMGDAAKARAESLLIEIHRRGLSISPIQWLD